MIICLLARLLDIIQYNHILALIRPIRYGGPNLDRRSPAVSTPDIDTKWAEFEAHLEGEMLYHGLKPDSPEDQLIYLKAALAKAYAETPRH